jgi:hypothetical protein
VTRRDPPKSAPADQPGDDFQRIVGIGEAIERRLHDAGILTYQDLAMCSPEQVAASLAGMAGLSPARIVGQDWTGQARKLAGSSAPPLPSEPSQHYASFHIELLLDVDGSVRRTKVHHHQSETDEAWPGWDEDRLLALLRDHIPLKAPRKTAEADDQESSAAPTTTQPETAAFSGDQPETPGLLMSMPSSCLHVESLGLTREGRRSYSWTPGESTSIGFTLRVNRISTLQAEAFDFTADVTARSELGDDQRWPLGTVQGAIRVDEPLPVELTGLSLPRGLYRLEATVHLYPTDHAPDSEPFHSERLSGALIQVADAPAQTHSRQGV